MTAKLLAAVALVLTLTGDMRVTVRSAAGAVTVPLPYLELAALVVALAVVTRLAYRAAIGFRSSPYPRPAWCSP